MRNRRQRQADKDADTTLRYLKALHYAMQTRINNGDLDFDDTVYRTRDACATLISIRESEWDSTQTDELINRYNS